MCCVLPLLKVQQLFWFTTSTAVDDGCNRDNVIETFFLRLQYSFLSWDSCKKMKNFSGPTKTTHTHFERQFIKLSDETVFYAKLLWILASRASSSRNSWLFGWCSWNLTKAGNEEKKIIYKLQLERMEIWSQRIIEIWSELCAFVLDFSSTV